MLKLLVPDANVKELLRRRRECGGDRYDEMWDGVYVMSPDPNNEHEHLGTMLAAAIINSFHDTEDLFILKGCNVSDRPEKWTKNFRVPDVAVFLPGNPAENRETHWLGGPDFAVEIISKGDRSRKKFDFYAKVNVKELLLVARKPWKLELYRRDGMDWSLVGISDLSNPASLPCRSLGLEIRLVPGKHRPRIEVARPADGRTWLA